jgi:hypothetical protein
MPELGGLYPQPPQPQQGLLTGDPMRLIGALQGIQSLQLQRAQIPALSQQPAATLQNTQIANQTAQMAQQEAARKMVWGAAANTVNGLDKPTPDDVHNAIVNLSRTFPQIATQYPEVFNSASDFLLQGGDIKKNSAQLGLSVMSPAEVQTRVAAPPTASGAPQSEPLSVAAIRGTQPTGVPPGFQERAAGAANIDTKLAEGWANAAEGSPARIAILGNLQDTLSKFTSGPGADWTKVGKAFVNRNVPLPTGWKFDPSSIGAQEEFGKQAESLVQSQFQTIGGTGTDAKFNSAYSTSPHDTLSQLGNEGIVRLLKGNEDAIQAKNSAWLAKVEANPNASARQFSQDFNNHFDPRIFQFKYLTPAERQAYVAKMDPQDQQRFIYNATVARKNKWIDYDMSK